MVEIKVTGVKEYQRALLSAQSISHRELESVVESSARLVLRDARWRVPRGPSGAARASLRIVEGIGARQVVAGGRRAPYFGWLDFGGVAGAQGPRRPYMRRGRYVLQALFRADQLIDRNMNTAMRNVVVKSGLG